MANTCAFSMRVKGEENNVREFLKWITAYYNYVDEGIISVYNLPDDISPYDDVKETVKIPCEHHIGYKVSNAYEEYNRSDSDGLLMGIAGTCAWSVEYSMFENDNEDIPNSKSITIIEASKELGLEIEIFSIEPVFGFSEHYYINKGEWECGEETEYSEFWLDWYIKDSDTYHEEAYNCLHPELKVIVDEAISQGKKVIITCAYMKDDEWVWKYL